jgi:precorrin-2/cobalt-factor-2 C20-methyltransferase
MAKLYGIGVGPGDKELLTLKAVRIIQSVDVIIVPSAIKGGESIAYETAKEYIKEGTDILFKHFPMGGIDREEKIYEAYDCIKELIKSGKNVGFLTIGDPFVYSTYIYLLEHIRKVGLEVETVPGITSFCSCAAVSNEHLVIGNEPLLITTATRLDTIQEQPFLVIMKVYKVEEKVIDLLEEKGYEYTYVKRAGREGQAILRNRDEIINNREYMSLIIARKKA